MMEKVERDEGGSFCLSHVSAANVKPQWLPTTFFFSSFHICRSVRMALLCVALCGSGSSQLQEGHEELETVISCITVFTFHYGR